MSPSTSSPDVWNLLLVDKIYPIAVIRRQVAAKVKKSKQLHNPRHTFYGHRLQLRRPKTRKKKFQVLLEVRRTELWENTIPHLLCSFHVRKKCLMKEDCHLLYEDVSIVDCVQVLKYIPTLQSGVIKVLWGRQIRLWIHPGRRHNLPFDLPRPITYNKQDLLAAYVPAVLVAKHWENKI